MAVGKFISIASLLGALSIVGCGDSGRNVCKECDNSQREDECRAFLETCNVGPDCPEQALALCSVI